MEPSFSLTICVLSLVFITLLSKLGPAPRFKVISKLSIYGSLGVALYLDSTRGLIDGFSTLLGYTTILTGLPVSVYTLYYSRMEGYGEGLDALMDCFIILVAMTYTAPNILAMAVAWTVAEVVGWYLITMGEAHSVEGSLRSARGFLVTSTLTFEISVFTVVMVSVLTTVAAMASANIGLLMEPFTALKPFSGVGLYLVPFLIIGFITKAANIPLHFWLPGAHSAAPAPASAVLSGLMTLLGFYGLYRVLHIVDLTRYYTVIAAVIATLGASSVIYGWTQIAVQRDGKKLLAYATIATNGYISLVFALYLLNPSGMAEDLLKLSILMHATYKTTLFAEVGLIEAVYGTRYIHGVRGLSRILPLSSIGGLLAVLTLIGVPGTIGFTVKALSVYYIVSGTLDPGRALVLLGFTIYIASSAYLAIKYMSIYFNTPRPVLPEEPKKPPKPLELSILALGSSNIYIPLVASVFLNGLRSSVLILSAVSPLTLLVTLLVYATVARTGGVKH
ncbi:Na+/H+ antiporter subunit D [Desulfurococcus mucosus]|uniref:NADH/Ubiquinone/plastoquinone (Complex I) n=1 Tax=Desulfurococcus mucosus (strain ATCC 35584 / DSM 2162 / JCM 9187 / O7/1) TaxID=765177 RepID=E8RAG8_DESM0|nr:Na+/H+ antiporter subunit D [Desulfurococcus mucosus]ADV64378.1 NADH/Ubiquinone/plastoquinone (complex I) [Desulfurococcus mucosus DSM 2162]